MFGSSPTGPVIPYSPLKVKIMSIVLQKEKEASFIAEQSDSSYYSEIYSFLDQIRNFTIPAETHSSPYTISLLYLLNNPLANSKIN